MNDQDRILISSFSTDLGWMGLALRDSVVQQLKFGFASEPKLLHAFDFDFDVTNAKGQLREWKSTLQRYASGKPADLSMIAIDLKSYTPFQSKVLTKCRQIGYGKTLTYGQLAEKAGSPNAARAVGSAMKRNRYPLIIPCHRVVASNGIGGYSAGDGCKIKAKLLALEGVRY